MCSGADAKGMKRCFNTDMKLELDNLARFFTWRSIMRRKSALTPNF